MTSLTKISGVIFWSIRMIDITKNFSVTASRATIIIMLLGCIVIFAGCMSANTESDLPWNTPQSWEGSVQLPGMGGGGF